MVGIPRVATARERREHYRENMLVGFNALAELYYACWGEYFHLAVYEPAESQVDPADAAGLAAAYERTHQRYLDHLGGATVGRVLDVACGGGAFSAWLVDRTGAEVLGVDQSDAQLAHAARWRAGGQRPTLRFVQHDVVRL